MCAVAIAGPAGEGAALVSRNTESCFSSPDWGFLPILMVMLMFVSGNPDLLGVWLGCDCWDVLGCDCCYHTSGEFVFGTFGFCVVATH